MNSNQIPKPEASLDAPDIDTTSSVDDFIRELEAKEKDLHITADMTIEIAESDFRPGDVQTESPAVQRNPAHPANTPPVGMKTRVYELENEVEALQDRVRGMRAERNEIQEKSDRRLKDFENYKYRMDRERRGAFIDQISNLASQMLPVLDNLDRALASVENMEREKSPEFQQFYDGIALVNQQVNEVFSEMGVQPIATVGETFDPHFHEAVAVETREGVAANLILDEMLRGYRIGNRVIRHSMVKVTSTPPNARLEEHAEPTEGMNNVSPEPSLPNQASDPAGSTPEEESDQQTAV